MIKSILCPKLVIFLPEVPNCSRKYPEIPLYKHASDDAVDQDPAGAHGLYNLSVNAPSSWALAVPYWQYDNWQRVK